MSIVGAREHRLLVLGWLLCSLLTRFAEAAIEAAQSDEVCGHLGDDCRYPPPILDDIFDDDEDQLSLSLLQMKAKRVQARRHVTTKRSASTPVEPPVQNILVIQPAEQEEETVRTVALPARSRHQHGRHQHGRLAPSALSLNPSEVVGSLGQLDARSRSFALQRISATVRERGQVALLVVVGAVLLVAVCASKRKRDDSVLQVQVRVDHFVTHSLGSKQHASKTPPTVVTSSKYPQASTLPVGCKQLAGTQSRHLNCSEVQRFAPVPVQDSAETIKPLAVPKAAKLEPIDAAFVLPLCETWYAACVEPMAACDGVFDIVRIAGYPRLRGTVRHVDGMRVLDITSNSLSAKQDQILASVGIEAKPPVAAVAANLAFYVFKVTGAGGQDYGFIRGNTDGSFVLSCGDKDVLTLVVENGRQLVLRDVDMDKVLAQASWFEQSDFFSGAGHLAIRVNPNVDTVLVLSCALALTIMGTEKSLIHFPRPATDYSRAD